VQVLDFSDATILKELSVDIDYFLYFLTCHMILGSVMFRVQSIRGNSQCL
jgi:hypothetical protein